MCSYDEMRRLRVVLCFVNAWKINVTCLVKGFIQKWLERSKIHA